MPEPEEVTERVENQDSVTEDPVVGESNNEELAGLLKLVAGSVRQTNERLNRLEGELRRPAPKEPEPPVDGASWIAEPEKNTRRVVKETVEEIVKPITEIAGQLNHDRQLNSVIEGYISEGGNADLVERYGKLIPHALKGQQLSPAAVDNAIIYLTGLEANGRLDKKNLVIKAKPRDEEDDDDEPPVTRRETKTKTDMNPPTRSPSPSGIRRREKPVPDEGAELSESQKAYARRAGLTPSEAAALINADARVDSWPRPKKKEEGK